MTIRCGRTLLAFTTTPRRIESLLCFAFSFLGRAEQRFDDRFVYWPAPPQEYSIEPNRLVYSPPARKTEQRQRRQAEAHSNDSVQFQ